MYRQKHCIAPGNEPCKRRNGLGADQVGSESLCSTDFSGFRRKVFRMALDRAFSSEDEHVRKIAPDGADGFVDQHGPSIILAALSGRKLHESSGTLTSREAGNTMVVLSLGSMPPCPP